MVTDTDSKVSVSFEGPQAAGPQAAGPQALDPRPYQVYNKVWKKLLMMILYLKFLAVSLESAARIGEFDRIQWIAMILPTLLRAKPVILLTEKSTNLSRET